MANRSFICCVLCLVCGCGTLTRPVDLPAFFPAVIVVERPTLDGEWIIADVNGDAFCITIQDSRVSIVNDGCRTDGLGFAARVTAAPEAVRAGADLILTATFEPDLFSLAALRLTFSGSRNPDGSYSGVLTTQELDAEEPFVIERQALLSRR